MSLKPTPSKALESKAPENKATEKPTQKRSESGRLPDAAHTLYLVDISSFIFRAFYAVRSLTTPHGEPVNAVYGVAQMLARLNEEARPEYLAIVYDSKEPSFRKEIYADYKANRQAPPDELIPQFDKIERLITAFEMHSYRRSGVEADDLIATLTHLWCRKSPQNHVVIVSSDKDLMQLVSERVSIWDTMNDKIYGEREVEGKFGVKPSQIRDYLALVGDSSDNIPGVPSVGPKTASDLLKQFGDLSHVLKAAREGKIPGKKGQLLVDHEKDALLSARLATVDTELPIEARAEDLSYRFHVTGDCAALLASFDFHSLLKRWAAQSGEGLLTDSAPLLTPLPFEKSPSPFRTVNTEGAFLELLARMEKATQFGFDLETTSLNPREAEIVGIAISTELGSGDYIPVGHRGTSVEQLPIAWVMEKLKPFLEDPRYKKVGQNLKYDWSVLYAQGLSPDGMGADTMVASYVLDPEGRHNLETLADQYLGYRVTSYEQVCGKGKDQIGFDQVPIDQATRYSAEDAMIALQLWNEFEGRLSRSREMRIFAEIDLPLVDVLARMEMQGVCVDTAYLEVLSKEFAKDLGKIEARIQTYARGPINLNSTQQLARLLFDQLGLPPQGKTKTGYSTDASVLEALADRHEVPRLLLEYREISKLKGTYVDPIPLLLDKKSGKIHASFHQTVAATGRLSSSDPNLQNIPIRTERGMKIRGAFVPSPGNVLLSADYSQIELRLLAHMSADPDLCRSFRENEDVHRRTASEIFGIPESEVDDPQRSIAKAINFGLMYGKTAFGLSQELKIPRREAQETIDRYFHRYSAVKRYLEQQIALAREQGFVETLLGRRRYLRDITARNAAVRSNAERMAMNTPIQGTAADLMKLAMIKIDSELRKQGLRSKLIIQVHDEVVLDCPMAEAPLVKELVETAMISAGSGDLHEGLNLSVPLSVNAGIGKTWLEL